MNERIKKLRKSLNLTLEKFGEQLGVKKAAVSLIESGRNSVTDQMLKSICLVNWNGKSVNEEWLRCGTGEMFIELSQDEEVAQYTQDLLDDTDDEVALLIKDFIVTYYSKLDDDSKKILKNAANEFMEVVKKRKETH